MSDFADTVNTWCRKASGVSVAALKLAVLDLCIQIIMDTPVDWSDRRDMTVARGDWNSGIGSDPGDINNGDETGASAIAKLQDIVAEWKPETGVPFVFVNHKDYIERIEYLGWDGHAPYGMVGLNVIEWDNIVERARARVNGTA
jgi:hypothetical protein